MRAQQYLFGIVIALVVGWHPCAAQTSVNGSLSVRATDASGAILPNVQVTLAHIDTNEAQTAPTDRAGQHTFSRVAPGLYRLTAEHPGFTRVVRENISISVNAAVSVDVTLQVAGVTDVVSVSSGASDIERHTSSMSLVVGDSQIRGLPLNSKDFQRLMYLAPGVNGPRAGNNNPSVSGTRITSNNYVLDGLSANEEQQTGGLAPGNQGLTVPNVISTEALQEFRVVTSNADATFGRGAGAQMNVITKSGTNRIRGSAYEYLRDDTFDARDFFNTAKEPPPFHQSLFGGTFGGPIARDRHFVFASYEGFRQQLEQTSSPTLPNAALLALVPGDLGRLLRTFYVGSNVVPGTGNPAGRFTGFSATDRAAALAAGFPTALFDGDPANDEAGVVVTSTTTTRDFNQDSWVLRTDHRLADTLTLSARYAGARSTFDTNLAIPSSTRRQERTFHNVLAQGVAVLTPTQVLEVRGGLLRTTAPNFPTDIDPALLALGIDPQRGLNLSLTGTTAFTLPFLSTNPLFGDRQTTPQVAAMHTWTRGGLTLRSGLDFRRLEVQFGNYGLALRTYQFTGLVGRSGLIGASPAQTESVAAVASTTLFGQGGAPPTPLRRYRSTQHEYFSQADWRLRHDLTLNLGLRYSIFGVYGLEGMSNLYAADASGNLALDLSPIALGRQSNRMAAVSGDTPFYQPDYDNWQPRLGVAWDVGGHGTTVLRAAYGIYDDRLFQFGFANVVTNTPFATAGSAVNAPFVLGTEIPINPAVPSIFGVDPAIRNPYFHRVNVGVQREIWRGTNVTAAYVGARGRDLARIVDLSFAGAFPVGQRPDSRFADMRLLTNVSESDYDALQMLVRSRIGSGLDVTAAYTYSRYRDFAFPDTIGATSAVPSTLVNLGASAATGYQVGPFAERTNFDVEYGTSELNIPHNLQVHHVVEVPFGRGRHWLAGSGALVDAIVGGWTIAGIFQARSGAAVDVQLGRDVNDDGNTSDRPVLLNGSLDDLYNRSGDRVQHFVPQADATQRLGAPADVTAPTGIIPRNAFRGPFVWTYDVSLLRRVNLSNRVNLAFEANVFNLFNRTNLHVPQGSLASTLFGRISQTVPGYGPRQVQLGAKLTF